MQAILISPQTQVQINRSGNASPSLKAKLTICSNWLKSRFIKRTGMGAQSSIARRNLAQTTDRREHLQSKYNQIANQPAAKPLIEAKEIVAAARKISAACLHTCSLEEQIHNCNAYLDSLLRSLNVTLPWNRRRIPTNQSIRHWFETCTQDWQQVWPIEDAPFIQYHPQPGDFCLWDKAIVAHQFKNERSVLEIKRIAHLGVLDGKGEILSASWHGEVPFAEGDWRLMCESPAFGTPTAIFRYKHVKQRTSR
jgi:hypothetical protein